MTDEPTKPPVVAEIGPACPTIPVMPTEHRCRQLLARAMIIINAAAGEGLIFNGTEEPENFMYEVAIELGFAEADDPWEDMIRMLQSGVEDEELK